jgi:uncharacterized membrane protein YfcA
MPGAAIPAVVMMAEAFPQDTRLSVGALVPILILGDLFALAWYRRHARWDRLWRLCPYVLLGMLPGYLVLRWIDPGGLRILLGGLVLALLAVELVRQRSRWLQLPHEGWLTGVAGVLAGFGTTVGNAAGPVMSIYLVSSRLEKQEFMGTAAWFFFLVNVSKLPFYASFGMMTPATFRFSLTVMPAVVLGAAIGLLLLRRIPQRWFNVLVLTLAALAAMRMVFG